jgi:phosphoglycolate phosphatase
MSHERAEKLRLVVFDCDGTLVDSQHSITAAMAQAFAACDLPAPVAEDVRRVVGLSLDEAIGRLVPSSHADRLDRLVGFYKQAFFDLRTQAGADHDPLFPGAGDVLDACDAAGIVMGIATGKSRRGLDAVLATHGLGHRFVTLQTADRHPGKPHPAMLQAAMDEAGIGRDDTVLVGDTSFDIDMANNAGVCGIGVSWGYHPVSELRASGAAHIVKDFSELMAVVESRYEAVL